MLLPAMPQSVSLLQKQKRLLILDGMNDVCAFYLSEICDNFVLIWLKDEVLLYLHSALICERMVDEFVQRATCNFFISRRVTILLTFSIFKCLQVFGIWSQRHRSHSFKLRGILNLLYFAINRMQFDPIHFPWQDHPLWVPQTLSCQFWALLKGEATPMSTKDKLKPVKSLFS